MMDSEKKSDVIPREELKPFLSKTAHDLNNLLSVIDGAARVLTKNPTPEKALQCVERIQKAVKRGSVLSTTLGQYCNPQQKTKKMLEGHQLLFKVVGVTALIVGESSYKSKLEECGFHIIEAKDSDDALMLQDEHEDDIEVLIWALDDFGGEEYTEFHRLYSSLREETDFISGFLEPEEFMINVYNAVDAALDAAGEML